MFFTLRSVFTGGPGIEEQEALAGSLEDDPRLRPEDPKFKFSNSSALCRGNDIVTLPSTLVSISFSSLFCTF